MKFREVNNPIHETETILPTRATAGSAGYDLRIKEPIILDAGETKLTFTDVKVKLPDDKFLAIHIRSSIGTKKHLMLANGTGIIDSDYYNNADNDGNIGIALHNYGSEVVRLDRGERVAQGVILGYTAFDRVGKVREGGFGSSGK